MQQQIQTSLTADQVFNDATSFFTKRRAKITGRSENGFEFGLPGGGDGGRVTISPASGGGSTVTVEAEGLGLLAIAEGYVRELRKKAKDSGRQSRAGSAGVALGDLRQRLGMPEPAPRQPRPQVAQGRPDVQGGGPRRAPATETSPGGQAVVPSESPQAISPEVDAAAESPVPNASAGPGAVSLRATEPDGPSPMEAAVVSPETGPQGAPAGDAMAVEGAHPAFTGPDRGNAGSANEATPVRDATSNVQPSAETLGGVPSPQDVHVETGPVVPNPGTPAGGAAGAAVSIELGAEASQAPGAAQRHSGSEGEQPEPPPKSA